LVKVTSQTANSADLTAYGTLFDEDGRCYTLLWKGDGVAEVCRITDGIAIKVTDRSVAEKLTSTRLFVDRSALPPAEEEEWYLTDLIGMTALDPAGTAIGTVSVVHDYGAGASLEIEREIGAPLLIPFTAACVPVVDTEGARLVVVPPDERVVRSDAGVVVHPDAELVVHPDAELVVHPDADLVVHRDGDRRSTPRAAEPAA
jgi:16S rRNA processing protein RimM